MIQKHFPVSLVFPPQGHFTQPYLALPCLQAHLKANGFQDVELIDASVLAYDHFLSRPYLERMRERVRERLPLAAFEERGSLKFEELEAFRAAAESEVSAAALVERVEAAKALVRGEGFWDEERYLPAMRTLYHGLRLVSAAHFPSQLTPHNFTMRYANDRSEEVLAATRDAQENPFLEYFESELLPALIERKPRVVGMSVIYGSQLIPALTLGRLIKAALPDCHVTAGGGFLAYVGKKVLAAPGMEECLDSIVFHEGEGPLLELCRVLERGGDLAEVGSLGWIDPGRAEEAAVINAPMHPLRLDDAPVPDFSGLPLDRYFSPELVIPYDVNRGCYYGECTFCTLPTVIGPGYRTRKAATIAEHVVELSAQLGTRNVNFITDCMPPGMLQDLPSELIAREADVRWWADARVEPRAYTEEGARLLYDSGCRKLLFGFETATPRLLKLMQKGQTTRAVLEVAENCARAGISVTFYAMVGFPSETLEEARDTLRVLTENAGTLREVSLQTFHIDEVAKTYHQPEQFGLTVLDAPGDLALYHDYESAVGMTQTEAAEAFEEMMSELRAALPLFSGDNLLFFMQKSHYFLHLAHDRSPDDFERGCRERLSARASLEVADGLVPAAGLRFAELAFPYAECVRRLGHPLARSVRPDFLTGRYVEGAAERAAEELGGLGARDCVLAYAPERAEFVELTADGVRVLDEVERAGDWGRFLAALGPLDAEQRAPLDDFAQKLHRLGCLRRPAETPDPLLASPTPTPS